MRAEKEMSAPAGGTSQNLVSLLLERAQAADKPGAQHKVDGVWKDVSWGQIARDVRHLSASLVARGVKPGDKVAVFAATSLNWLIVDLAINAAQAITIPIYASNTPDECRYILQNSESIFAFVDNDEKDGKQEGRVSRIRSRLAECPTVRQLVLFSGAPQGDKEVSLQTLLAEGEKAHDEAAFLSRVGQIRADDPACFIYTSGTTGDPKGVILTHGNWSYEASAVKQLGLMVGADSVLLFLPLAHSFAQVTKAAWLGMGFKMVLAESVEKLLANLAETSPSVLPSVPRVFEKVYNGVLQNATSAPGVKGKLGRWAFRLFDEYVDAKNQGKEYDSLGWALAKRLVFSKVKATLEGKLGGKMRIFISGGAPLSRKIAYFFDLLGFKVLEGYGLTETSAATTINRPEKIKIGTVGAAVPGTEIKIAEDGEILIKGPGVMKGYYKNPNATAEAIDAQGWFHSGDIGEVDADGYVKITDRKKDIIVTAGGKNVAPQNIENLLKTHGIISQSMVYGDKRQYLSVLITVNEDAAKKLISDKGGTPGPYASLGKTAEVKEAVQAAINSVNAELPPYSTLKKFAILEKDFSQEDGEMTPTLKVKRKACTAKYQAVLNGLYDGKAAE